MGFKKLITYYNMKFKLIYNWPKLAEIFYNYMKIILIQSKDYKKNLLYVGAQGF